MCQGDPNGTDPFDRSVEWDGYPNDTFDGLGAHTSNCGPTPTNASTWGRVKSLYRWLTQSRNVTKRPARETGGAVFVARRRRTGAT